MTADVRARALAFYLPQFYPIPENDLWWGKGFTEWRNVSNARPQFAGHYQPHVPRNLGFYDLRVPEARAAQAALAGRHGIEAFCYWHYWFRGKRLLERPFNEVLASGEPDFPFCLAWANETWSRRWLGEEKDVLKKQTYSASDDATHAAWLVEAFGDARYVTVHGRALFLIYKPFDLPDPVRTTDLIREACVQAGLQDAYLLGVNAHRNADCRPLGFDGTVDFEPQLGLVDGALEAGLKVYDYASARQLMVGRSDYPVHECIFVGWDNTPRRGNDAIVFVDSTPEVFQAGLEEIVSGVADRPLEDRLVFINAWNEWAEGNHLEPDHRHGLGFLEAVRSATTPTRSGVRLVESAGR